MSQKVECDGCRVETYGDGKKWAALIAPDDGKHSTIPRLDLCRECFNRLEAMIRQGGLLPGKRMTP